jgi:hypothetical protein
MRPNKKDMPANFGPKQLKLKKKKQYIQGAWQSNGHMLETQESGIHALKHTPSSSQ